MVGTHQGRVARASMPSGDTEAIANEPVEYMSHEKFRNLSVEADQQRDPLQDYFNYVDASAGQEEQI